MIYECHITIALADAEAGERVAKELHWSTSQIERDPVLGKDSYFYLTTHDSQLARIKSRMHHASFELKEAGVNVIREKIEHIVYDTKMGGYL